MPSRAIRGIGWPIYTFLIHRKNVARWVKPPKDEHEEKPVLSVAEAILFLEAILGDPMEALYLLAVTTGLLAC